MRRVLSCKPLELFEGKVRDIEKDEYPTLTSTRLELEEKENDKSYLIRKKRIPYFLVGFYTPEDNVEFDFLMDKIKFRYKLKKNELFYACNDTYYLPYKSTKYVNEYRIQNFTSDNIFVVKEEMEDRYLTNLEKSPYYLDISASEVLVIEQYKRVSIQDIMNIKDNQEIIRLHPIKFTNYIVRDEEKNDNKISKE